MSARSCIALLALCALVQQGVAINGGSGCQYVSPRQVLDTATANGLTPVQANDIYTRMQFVNYYLCRSCNKRAFNLTNVGALIPNLGECWCKAGYGYAEIPTGAVGLNGAPIIRRQYLCTKCPTGGLGNYTGNSNPTTGPYNPAQPGPGPKWTKTVCEKQTSA